MNQTAKLVLHPAYRVSEDGPRRLFADGGELLVLEGAAVERLLPRVLPQFDGTRSASDIVATFPDPVRPAVRALLDRLVDSGLVVDAGDGYAAAPTAVREGARYLAMANPTAELSSLLEGLAGATALSVLGSGSVAARIRDDLLCPGAEDDWDSVSDTAGFTVVAPSSVELARLPDWNRHALELDRPWLAVLPYEGRYLAVGPLVLPGETCCYHCYRIRRSLNLGFDASEDALLVDQAESVEPPPWIAGLAAGLAVDMAYRWLATRDPYLPGMFHAVEFVRGFRLTQHYVLRVPRCPACSPIRDLSPLAPWYDDPGPWDRSAR